MDVQFVLVMPLQLDHDGPRRILFKATEGMVKTIFGGDEVRLLALFELDWARDKINLDVDGRSICIGDPSFRDS